MKQAPYNVDRLLIMYIICICISRCAYAYIYIYIMCMQGPVTISKNHQIWEPLEDVLERIFQLDVLDVRTRRYAKEVLDEQLQGRLHASGGHTMGTYCKSHMPI